MVQTPNKSVSSIKIERWPDLNLTHDVFKFLDNKDVPFLVEQGSIQFRTLSYYRTLESKTAGIADASEGITHVAAAELKTENQDEAMRFFANFDTPGQKFKVFDIAKGAVKQFEVSGNTVTYILDHDPFIFCASTGALGELRPAMSGPKGYNACVRIRDLLELVQLIVMQGTISNLNDVPFLSVFNRFNAMKVEYAKIRTNPLHESAKAPDPFVKDEQFSWQKGSKDCTYANATNQNGHDPSSCSKSAADLRDRLLIRSQASVGRAK